MSDRYAVLGNPIDFSKSPFIHMSFAQATGQDIEYTKLLGPLGQFDATVDELETLKKLEMGELVTTPQALKEHLSGRLYERGYIGKNSLDELTITDAGRALIRRPIEVPAHKIIAARTGRAKRSVERILQEFRDSLRGQVDEPD